MKKEGLHRRKTQFNKLLFQLSTSLVSFSFVDSAETMALSKTSEDKSLDNPSKQLDHEKILTNWDEYLAPAPMGIFVMSQLLINSTRVTDFKINKIDKNKINLIIHPDSFCTTLVQIANESYEAFMLAHNNMERIHLQMAQVPDYVSECVELLNSKNKNAIEKFLPIPLARIKEAAADGLTYSKQVCDAFDRLGQLIGQVLLAIPASQGARIEEIEELIRKGEEKKRELEYKQREQDRLQKEIEGAQEAVQRTQKNAEEASNVRVEDFFTIGITYLVRNATSTSNKKQAEIMLHQLKQEAKQIDEEREKVCNDYTNSMKKLQIETKDVSTDDIIKLLNEGTRLLADLQKNWAGITLFFKRTNDQIDIVTNKNLVDFAERVEFAKDNTSLLKHLTGSIAKSLESSTKSHLIAATYVKVSDKYIMEPLKQMHGMLSIEPAKLKETQDDLLELCEKAMKGITDMGKEDRNKTVREMENQVKSIQN